MKIHTNSDTGLNVPDKVFFKKNDINSLTATSQNIQSYFQLAKAINARVDEIETGKQEPTNKIQSDIQDDEHLMLIKNHFLEAVPNPIFLADKRGHIVGCNTEFEELVRQRKSSILGHGFEELGAQEPSIINLENLSTITPGDISRFEIKFVNHFEEYKNLIVVCTSLERNATVAYMCSITDVTEIVKSDRIALIELESKFGRLQTEMEYQHQKLKAVSELLVHSRNVKLNFIEAVSKLHPYLTNEGRAKFFSLIRQIHWDLNDEKELYVEKDFDQLHAKLYRLLEKYCPTITKNEKRLCAYLLSNHHASDIAKIANKSMNSINVALARLRSKLRLPNSKELRSFVLEMSQNELMT